MAKSPSPTPNPKRIAAGKLNVLKRKGLTEEGRERVRQSTLRFKPWRFATGPRTAEGKTKSAANGKHCELGPRSLREVQAELAELRGLVNEMRECRRLAAT